MFKKAFLFLILGTLLLNSVSAWDWDNVVAETGTHPVTGYPTMQINNCDFWVGIPTLFGTCLNKGETLFEGAVTEHTKQCGTDCSSKMEFNHNGGVLIDDIRFLTEQNDGSWIKQPVRSYKLKYEAKLPEYETQCVDLPEVYVEGNATNGTSGYYYTPQECSQVQVGTYTGFKEYKVGKSLPAGYYEMFLEAEKKPSRTVDWQIKVEGRWMEEWAVWGNISLGDDAEVILNSPEDGNISYTGSVTFNATANVTNGAYLTNMSLWTNATGTWALNETIVTGGASAFNFTDGSLVAYYPLNETTGTVRDVSMTGHDGLVGNAFDFEEDRQYVELGDISLTTTRSASAWVYLEQLSNYETIIGTDASGGYQLIVGSDGTVYGNLDGTAGVDSGTNKLSTGQWYHIVHTYNAGSHKLYFNGTEVGTATATNTISDNTLRIAKTSSHGLQGSVDEVGLWSKVLTPTEITSLWNSGNGKSYADLTAGEKTNLVSYYSLDEVGSDPLDSHGSNDGTLSGGTAVNTPTRGATGVIEQAFTFDRTSSEYIDTNSNEGIDFTSDDFSVSVWFNASNLATDDKTIVGWGNGGVSPYGHWLLKADISSNNLQFWTYSGGTYSLTGTTTISANTLYHAVVTVNGTTAKIYLNNNLEDTDTIAIGTAPTGYDEIYIGKDIWTTEGGYFDGMIDEIGIWNRALNSTEISELYNSGAGLAYGTTGSTSLTQTWNKTISDTTIWNVEACDTDGDCGWATSNYTVYLDATAPTVSITSPTSVIETHVIGDALTLNVTVNDTNLDTCWYEYNGVNTTIEGCVSGVQNSTTFNSVAGQQTITVYANDSVSNLDSDSQSWTYNFIENSATYDAYAYETQSDTFILNFTTQITVQSISAELKHNGDSYTSTATCDDSDCLLTNTIDLPLVTTGESQNKTFYWEFTIFDGSTSNTYNSTSREQNISRIYFISCGGAYTTEALNFTAAREDNLTAINPFYFAGTFDYWLGSGDIFRTYSSEEVSAANVDLCISPVTETFHIDGTIDYDGAGSNTTYIPRSYIFDNYNIANSSENITLLLLEAEDSTTFIQEVLEAKVGVEGAIIYTERYYPGTNSWNITQITKTASNGKTVGFYEAETATYRHYITVDEVVRLNETAGRKMIPETVPYTITWELDEALSAPWEIFDDELGLSKALFCNDDTGVITFTYTGNSSFSNGNLTVYKENYATDDELVCNNSNSLASASITCNISTYEGNFIARAYADRGTETLYVDSTRCTINTGKDTFGKGGVLLAWFIILVAGTAFLVHPIIGIVAINLAIVLVNLIGLVTFGWLFVFGIMAISGVLIWLMKD